MKHLMIATAAVLLVGGVGHAGAQTPQSASPSYGSYGTDTNGAGYSNPRRDMAGDSYTQALNLLEARGYTGIQNFRRVGGIYQATATRNGRSETVSIDPAARTVHPVG